MKYKYYAKSRPHMIAGESECFYSSNFRSTQSPIFFPPPIMFLLVIRFCSKIPPLLILVDVSRTFNSLSDIPAKRILCYRGPKSRGQESVVGAMVYISEIFSLSVRVGNTLMHRNNSEPF